MATYLGNGLAVQSHHNSSQGLVSMLNVKVDLCSRLLALHLSTQGGNSITLVVILGPRGSLDSAAWTRASPAAKTRKRDKKRFLKYMTAHNAPFWMDCRRWAVRGLINQVVGEAKEVVSRGQLAIVCHAEMPRWLQHETLAVFFS